MRIQDKLFILACCIAIVTVGVLKYIGVIH